MHKYLGAHREYGLTREKSYVPIDSPGAIAETVGQWGDQSATGLDFIQATQGNRPLLTASGGAQFDTTTKRLSASGAVATSGGMTMFVRSSLRAMPGAGDYFFTHRFRTDQGSTYFCSLFLSGAPGYQAVNFEASSHDSTQSYVGVVETLDTNVHTRTIRYNGSGSDTPANYSYRLDGAAGTVTTSGISNNGAVATEIGTGSAPIDPHGDEDAIVIYSSSLSDGDCTAIETLLAAGTATEAVLAGYGTLVCCLLPNNPADTLTFADAKQSGDLDGCDDMGHIYSGTNHALTRVGSVDAHTPYLKYLGASGRPCLDFPSAGMYAQFSGGLDLSGQTKLAIGGKFYVSTLASAQRLISQAPSALNDNALLLSVLTTGEVRFLLSASDSDVTTRISTNTGAIAAAGEMYFILGCFDGGQGTAANRGWVWVYRYSTGVLTRYSVADGNAAATGTIPAAINSSASVVRVGHDSSSFLGELIEADVLFDQDLDAYQVRLMAETFVEPITLLEAA